MKSIPVVCYLFTCFDNIDSLRNFKKYYLKYKAGLDHELVICFKLLDSIQIQNVINELTDIKFYNFKDSSNKNDFDFGSYKRVSEKFLNRDIFFLNSHSYPICDNWLDKLMKFKDDTTLIGASASNESLVDSMVLKKKYKIISYLINKLRLKIFFNKFPNPHVRTSSFLISSNIFLDYISKKKINNKFDAWKLESGKNSLTNYFKNKNYKILIINSDGSKFEENNWKLSETYNYFKQSKSIISDKHTRKYDALDIKEKLISRIKVWGE